MPPIGVYPIEPVDVKATVPTTAIVTIDGGSLGISGSAPIIFNVAMPVAGTEYSQLLPDHTKAFQLKARNNSVLQLAYAAGAAASDYIKIPSGQGYDKDNLDMTGLTLYFLASVDGEVAQITAWI